jgi:hypothetical protein
MNAHQFFDILDAQQKVIGALRENTHSTAWLNEVRESRPYMVSDFETNNLRIRNALNDLYSGEMGAE